MATIDLKKQDRIIELEVDKQITTEDAKKKYYIAELIKNALNQYLDFDDLVLDNTYSAYTLPIVNEKTDFIDFDLKSLSVHVVPTIDKAKNQNVYIPKSYKDYACKPDVLIFVNFTKALSKVTILGFVTDINLNNLAIQKSNLRPVEELIATLKTLSPKTVKAEENVINAAKELMLAYIEEALSEEGEQFFLKHLLLSKEIRKNYKLFYALHCKFISVAKKHTMIAEEPQSVDNIDNGSYQEFIPVQPVADAEINEEPILLLQDEQNNEEQELLLADSFPEEEQDEQEEQSFQEEDAIEEQATEETDFLATEEEPVELFDATEDTTFDETHVELLEEDLLPQDISQNQSVEISLNENEFDVSGSDLSEDTAVDLTVVAEENSIDEITFDDEGDSLLDVSDMEQDLLLEDVSSDVDNLEQQVEYSQDDLDESALDVLSVEEETSGVEEISSVSENVSALVDNAQEDGDDLFSFLSEMADEVKENEQNENLQYEQETQEITEDNYQYNQENEEEIVEQEVEPEVSTSDIQLENAFNEDNENAASVGVQNVQADYAAYAQASSQNSPSSYASKKALLVLASTAVLLAACGAGVYYFKDQIPLLNNSSEIQDLAIEDELKTDELPPVAEVPGGEKADAPVPPGANDPTLPPSLPGGTQDAKLPAPEAKDVPAAPVKTVPPIAKEEQKLPELPKTVEPPKPKNINDAIAKALTKDFAGVRISKVSWEVSETLVNNTEVKQYLTIAGKSIKNALSQDLMAATEPSFKENIAIDIVYRKDGAILNVRVTSSSGSSQIDGIVVKTVRDTLNYIKMPPLNIDKSEYTAKLIVRL